MPGFGKLLPEAIQLGRGFINASDPWLDYRALKALLEAICAERGLVFDRKAAGGDGGGAEPPPYPEKSPLTGEALAAALAASPAETAFFVELDRELDAITSFYDAKEEALAGKYNAVMAELSSFVDSQQAQQQDHGAASVVTDEGSSSSSSAAAGGGGGGGGAAASGDPLAEVHIRLLTMLVNLFNQLVLLENYAVLNHVGFSKILKKHSKVAGWAGVREGYMHGRVNVCAFALHRRLRRMVLGARAAYDLLMSLSPVPDADLVMDGDDAEHHRRVVEVQTGLRAQREAMIGAAAAAVSASAGPSSPALGARSSGGGGGGDNDWDDGASAASSASASSSTAAAVASSAALDGPLSASSRKRGRGAAAESGAAAGRGSPASPAAADSEGGRTVRQRLQEITHAASGPA